MCTISRTKNSERNLPPVSHPPYRNQQSNYRTLCLQESYRIFLLAIPSWSPAPTSFIPIERAHICRSRYQYINKTAIQDHHLRVTKYLRKPLAQEPYIIKDSSNASGKYKLNIATNLIPQGYRHLISAFRNQTVSTKIAGIPQEALAQNRPKVHKLDT